MIRNDEKHLKSKQGYTRGVGLSGAIWTAMDPIFLEVTGRDITQQHNMTVGELIAMLRWASDGDLEMPVLITDNWGGRKVVESVFPLDEVSYADLNGGE